MKPWITLIAGVVLIITPQIIVGVVAANTAWVQSAYLMSVARIEAEGLSPSAMLVVEPLPSMPMWMTVTSIGVGILLCVLGVLAVVSGGRKGRSGVVLNA